MTSTLVYVVPTKIFWKSWTRIGYWKITVPSESAGDGLTRECETPHARRGTATANPAIGPATAMSKSWRLVADRLADADERAHRSDEGDRGGKGMKYGGDASMP